MRHRVDITVCSDIDFEELIAQAAVDGELFLVLNQDQGEENLEVVVYPRQDGGTWRVSYDQMQEILAELRRAIAPYLESASRERGS